MVVCVERYGQLPGTDSIFSIFEIECPAMIFPRWARPRRKVQFVFRACANVCQLRMALMISFCVEILIMIFLICTLIRISAGALLK